MNYLNLDQLSYHTHTFIDNNFQETYSNNMSSPEYTSSASSNEMSPASTSTYDYYSEPDNFHPTEPYLVITEQPMEQFRFRYQSEMHGTHGQLMGRRKEKQRKTYPSVELRNYTGSAEIVCLLYQANKESVHSHKLVVKQNDLEINDPHVAKVSQENGYKATFPGMGIIHTVQKNCASELYRKKIVEHEYEANGITTEEYKTRFENEAEKETKPMNLNQVRLCFKAYTNEGGVRRKICNPVLSTPINNMKSAMTGDLKISRCSRYFGSMTGNEELFLFVEKVSKSNIKVKFHDPDNTWTAWGNFTETDVHHQYAIFLRTPPYTGPNQDQTVVVLMELYRPSDERSSQPLKFTYTPTSRKRARCDDSYGPDLPVPIENLMEQPSTSRTQEQQQNEEHFISHYCSPSDLEKLLGNLNNIQVDNDSAGIADKCKGFMRQIYEAGQKLNELEKPAEIYKKIFTDAHKNDQNLINLTIETGNFAMFKYFMRLIQYCKLDDILNLRNTYNDNALHIACTNNKSVFIVDLIKQGCNTNCLNDDGFSALHIAVDENHRECINELLKMTKQSNKKLNINLLNSQGQAAIHLAVLNDNLKVAQQLIDGGVNLSVIESETGKNVLHFAIEEKSKAMVLFLLKNAGTDLIHQKDKNGETPLQLAESNKSDKKIEEIIETLKDFLKSDSSQIVTDGGANEETIISIKIEPEVDGIFDEHGLDTLSGYFEDTEAWKRLAVFLKYEGLISVWETIEKQASRMLFNYYELVENNTIKLENALTLLDKYEACQSVREMVDRRKISKN